MWGRGRCWLWRQTMTLVKVDRLWHTVCIKCMKLIVKYFFLADILFFGGSLILESSCIRVNTVLCRFIFTGARHSSKILVNVYQITQQYIPKDSNIQVYAIMIYCCPCSPLITSLCLLHMLWNAWILLIHLLIFLFNTKLQFLPPILTLPWKNKIITSLKML